MFDLLVLYFLFGDNAIYAYDCLVKSTPRGKVSARRALVLKYDIYVSLTAGHVQTVM